MYTAAHFPFPSPFSGSPLQYSCLENPLDGGTWQATVFSISACRGRAGPVWLVSFVGVFEWQELGVLFCVSVRMGFQGWQSVTLLNHCRTVALTWNLPLAWGCTDGELEEQSPKVAWRTPSSESVHVFQEPLALSELTCFSEWIWTRIWDFWLFRITFQTLLSDSE